MLTIIRSNRVEALMADLSRRIAAQPAPSPMLAEYVVVPSPAMGRWVNLQLALAHGVAANVHYPLPSSFVLGLAARLLEDVPDQDPLRLEVLTWRVFGMLPSLLAEKHFEPLARYLEGDTNGRRRLQLAVRIADVFDRYQLYRPELLRSWEQGEEQHWQAELWRRLTGEGPNRHRLAIIDRLMERLAAGHDLGGVPERFSLFAISSLPPLLVGVVQALASRTRVDLYLHTPTDGYWADLVSQRALARKRLQSPEQAELWEVGNPLLASWGRQGQALQDLLLGGNSLVEDRDLYQPPPGQSLLGHVQQDIFDLRGSGPTEGHRVVTADDSLQVHVCHSPLRECQVLRDELLRLLDAEPDLRPEDILVMVPEISAYAPYIEAVFRTDPGDGTPKLPWNLSDISIRDEHPLMQVCLSLLALPQSRFSHSEVLSYLDVPELAEHFGLDGEQVTRIKAWLDRANVRWGLDQEHKTRLGLPGHEENTWAQAERRLFGGYALGEVNLFEDIAPIAAVEGAEAATLGRFWHLFSRLRSSAQSLARPRTALQWQARLNRLLEEFFGERPDEEGRLQRFRDTVAELAEQAGDLEERLDQTLVQGWLEERLQNVSRHGRYLSGGVTFCGMRPMRSLPFPVVCVLGLQDQAFPRQDRFAEFDLMRSQWRQGDPRKADEDRYLFLETLLCARRRLYLSYVGRDIRTNKPRQPSVLLGELLDYLDQQFRIVTDGREERPTDKLTRVHSLQPFSVRNYAAEPRSYDPGWCRVAEALARPPADRDRVPEGWPGLRLPEAPAAMREVTLVQLERFLRHPVRYFVNSRLQVYLGEEESEADEELFALDGLQRFLLRRRLVDERLRGRAATRQLLDAEGVLPHGACSDLAFEEQRSEVRPLLKRLEDYLGRKPMPLAVEMDFSGTNGPRRLSGQVPGLYPELGLLRWTTGSLKGADIMALWMAHLACCAAGQPGDGPASLHGGEQSFVIRHQPGPGEARDMLQACLGWYWEGVHRPLPLLPGASFAFARRSVAGGRADPMNEARSRWQGNEFRGIPGDRDDAYVALVMRGVAGDPLQSEEFSTLAKAIYGPALEAGEII